MKLAVSNIAWEQHDDPKVLSMLREAGVTGIEVAPTKVWPSWKGMSTQAATSYRRQLANEGFEIPALQAILFGFPDFQVFVADSHAAFIEHLKRVADIAAALGATVSVFGSPKNRRRGQLSVGAAMSMAADFFGEVGELFSAHGCCIGLEHNPVEYGCDFITSGADAREFVDQVASDGIGLHLDSGGLHMSGGEITTPIRTLQPCVHYHASEPMLAPLADGVVDHGSCLRALRATGYERWVSIEMKQPPEDAVTSIRRSIDVVSKGWSE